MAMMMVLMELIVETPNWLVRRFPEVRLVPCSAGLPHCRPDSAPRYLPRQVSTQVPFSSD